LRPDGSRPQEPTAPPRLAEWLVAWSTRNSTFGNALRGDLREGFSRAAAVSCTRAAAWYWSAAISVAFRYSLIGVRRPALGRDVGYAWRVLSRAPVFTVVVTLTLAVGIGANAAVLGVIDTMYFRKLPVPHPERIVGIYTGDVRDRGARELRAGGWSSRDVFDAVHARLTGVAGVAMYDMATLNAGAPLDGEPIFSAVVTGDYFDLLGIEPERGRFIRRDDDDATNPHAVVVMSDVLWRTRFSAADSVIGASLQIGKGIFTIIGVAPRGFTGLHPEGRTDLWVPSSSSALAKGRVVPAGDPRSHGESGVIIARMAPGATLSQVQSSADVVAHDLAVDGTPERRRLALYARIRDRLTTVELSGGGFYGTVFVWLMIALLHLASCTNVASLMLARASARRREIGIRLCLGASRWRIVIQAMVEAAILALLGGAGGLLVGRWLSGALAQMQFLSATDAGLDTRVVAIVTAVSVATVFQFGLLPALDASRNDPLTVLRGNTGGPRSRRGDRSEMVVVIQVVLSVLLLGNAAAFVRMFEHQITAAPGYDVQHVSVVRIQPRMDVASPAEQTAHYDDVMRHVTSVPGVVGTAAAVGAPLYKPQWFGEIVVPDRTPDPDAPRETSLQAVGPSYFATIGAPLTRGREFGPADRTAPGAHAGAYTVVIVNSVLARRLWGDADALGKQLSLRGGSPATVVGIAPDILDVSIQAPVARAYFPLLETAYATFEVVVRTSDDASASAARIRGALSSASNLSAPEVRTLSGIRNGALSLSRTVSAGLTACALIALLLAAVGLYGIVAMWAARRRAELGIRIALGARARDVYATLLGGATRLVAIGVALGLVCAAGLVQVERSRMGPALSLDVVTIAASVLTLCLFAGLAGFLPARRATRHPPADVLRSG
jgi:putative ABC transport system permease protein